MSKGPSPWRTGAIDSLRAIGVLITRGSDDDEDEEEDEDHRDNDENEDDDEDEGDGYSE